MMSFFFSSTPTTNYQLLKSEKPLMNPYRISCPGAITIIFARLNQVGPRRSRFLVCTCFHESIKLEEIIAPEQECGQEQTNLETLSQVDGLPKKVDAGDKRSERKIMPEETFKTAP